MRKNWLISIVLISMALVFVLSSCSTSPSSTPTSNMTITTGTTSASQSTTIAAGSAVSIESFAFNPATLTVKAGTVVTWTNNDSAMHNIKSDSFNSPELAKGETFSFTFTNKGTFEYSCGIHPSMTGNIVVE